MQPITGGPCTIQANDMLQHVWLLCEKGDMDMAHKLMIKIGLIDLYPNMMTYFAMIKGFNLLLDTIAYNVVIRLLCEKGDMDMAHKLMIKIGLIDLYPDMMTYFAMIKGFCNAGRLEEACELFQAMNLGKGFI
ncbi:hypothetical protein PVK06_007715 [Gossypium arboreum]|uniref:Pentatricopeptide repeat-containing protein n=1 Tax=Gossypium arboreum TaxID=29729 RepID=A0ABR0QI09_GOSAR|nr:hypothetical protein PVK06_007715 [Gossypium arboreum]